jgi:hypothetical protein
MSHNSVWEAVVQWFMQQHKEVFAYDMTTLCPWYSCLNDCCDFFLAAAIPSPVSILEWVSVVRASYIVRIH